MRSKLLLLLLSWILVFFINTPLVQADIVNGNFSGGLSGWTTEEFFSDPPGWTSTTRVSVNINGIAVLTTEGSVPGTLISLNQGTGVIPSFSVLSFDFGFSGGNPNIEPDQYSDLGFPDFLQVYFLDSIDDSPDLNPGFVGIDPNGPYDLNPLGLLTPILNNDFLLYHFSMDISGLAGREGILYFDLSNQDDGHDSLAFVDNVSITAAVPEPATFLLLGSGLAILLSFTRRRLLLTRR